MAANPHSGVHNDSWQSDNYASLSGPLGRKPQTLSTSIGRDCITLTFDPQGRLISSCSDLTHGPALYLLNPRTLATLATCEQADLAISPADWARYVPGMPYERICS